MYDAFVFRIILKLGILGGKKQSFLQGWFLKSPIYSHKISNTSLQISCLLMSHMPHTDILILVEFVFALLASDKSYVIASYDQVLILYMTVPSN